MLWFFFDLTKRRALFVNNLNTLSNIASLIKISPNKSLKWKLTKTEKNLNNFQYPKVTKN